MTSLSLHFKIRVCANIYGTIYFFYFFFFFAATENVFCSLASKILWKWQQRFPEHINLKLEHKENHNLRCFVDSTLEYGLYCLCAIVLIHTYLQKIDTFQIIVNRMTNFVNST